MEGNGEAQEPVVQQDQHVPEASLGQLSNFAANQDIARLEATVEANIGLASDGKP